MIPNLTNKTHKELIQLAKLTEELKLQYKYNYIQFVMPDNGPYARSKYHKALEFFAAGKDHRFRMIGGSNGSGKSFDLALEITYHATGDYPVWWEGKVLKSPKLIWIISESGGTWKDSLQRLLLGNTLNDEDFGTGLIPKHKIKNTVRWPSLGETVQNIEVQHKNGHTVTISVKSSDQKRENLQAANVDLVAFDEEPPLDIYTECMFRLRGSPTKPPGISILAFTPLKGLTEVVLKYLEDGAYPENGQHSQDPEKYVVRIEMDEVPHLTESDKQMYLSESTPADVEARTKGLPSMGAGKIYPYAESMVFCRPFKIPDYWPRCYGLDFGHHVTAAVWGAQDPHTKCIYLYAEYYSEGHQTAQVHSLNIKSKGAWIKGICDPNGGGRQDDGRLLMDIFRTNGLNLTPGENSIVAGITRNCNMFENGTLKIFDTLQHTKKEYRLYRFDSKDPNKPARNQKDHAMDAMKYLTSMFDYVATSDDDDHEYYNASSKRRNTDESGY